MRTDRPEKIRIGYRDFTIRFVDKVDAEGSLGDCEKNTGKIRVMKGMDGAEKANVVLHEITHAIIHAQGLDLSEKTEEKVVLAIANGMISFMRDNPRFMGRLLRLLKKLPE